jgi:hypothetical protein
MSDIRELLEREVRPLAPPDAWEPVHRRAGRRRRNRRIGTAVLALAVAGAGTAGAWRATVGLHRGTHHRTPVAGTTWDGGRIVYGCDGTLMASNASTSDLCTMSPEGSDSQVLGDPPTARHDPAWSSDGSQIAFTHEPAGCDGCIDIGVMDTDGSNVRRVTRGIRAENPVWSPDGRWIAFDTGHDLDGGSLMKVRIDGSSLTTLTAGLEAAAGDSYPSWSPDGKEIAFVRAPESARNELDVMSADGTDVRLAVAATDVTGAIGDPAWSPDGRFVVFAVEESRNRSSLWEWDRALEGDPKNHPNLLWTGPGRIWNPEWIEGGAQIAFLHGVGDSMDLVAIRFDGLDAPVRIEELQGPEGTTQLQPVGSGQPRTIVADFPGEQFSFQPPPGGAAGACTETGPSQFISCAEAIRRVADTPPMGASITASLVRGSLRPDDEGRWVWAVVEHDVIGTTDPPSGEGAALERSDQEVDVDAETGQVVAEGPARSFGGGSA